MHYKLKYLYRLKCTFLQNNVFLSFAVAQQNYQNTLHGWSRFNANYDLWEHNISENVVPDSYKTQWSSKYYYYCLPLSNKTQWHLLKKSPFQYGYQFNSLWNRSDLLGFVTREILQSPCVIQTYVKDVTNHQNIVTQELPARLSLRRLGSHAFVVWLTLGYIMFKLFSYSGFFYIFVLAVLWLSYVFTKASFKMLRLI